MKVVLKLMAAGLSLSILAACETPLPADETESLEIAQMDQEPEGAPGPACAVLESKSWEAWINAMPGPDASPTLHVAGDVLMPTPGYTLALTEGRTDRSAIPALQLILTVTPPEDEMVMQVLTPETVKFEGPALPNGYSKITVMCSGTTLAEITEIIIAQ